MQKNRITIFFLDWVMIFWKYRFTCKWSTQNLQIAILKTRRRYIHLKSKHVRNRNLEFTFPVWHSTIWWILLSWPTYCQKIAKKWRPYWIFKMDTKSKTFKIATPNLRNATQGKCIPNFRSLACLLFKWMYLL